MQDYGTLVEIEDSALLFVGSIKAFYIYRRYDNNS